ncbi:LOW QUALITY PROTEIN: branched-chain alpha-keto acid dehydrogenase, E1 component, beta subunit [Geomicrobium sp. JCM 19037]|nr:LOW QUALITY PROTEIN: branched-chain alpha-keto acid dehydrogenase, E1 component, beta subunit [Geomicrobium sp. JCM 19037]
MNYLGAINLALKEEMERDEKVFILGEDVGKRGGVFLATEGLYEQFGDRVLDTPLSESAIAGVGIGAAMYGMSPVAEMQFADFMLPAVNQIVSEAAKIRYRSNNDFHVPLTVRAPYGGGVHGALYHSQSMEAMFNSIPGLKIVIPSSPYDAKGLLKAAIRDEDPVLFFEHKRAYRLLKGEVPEEDYTLPIGKAAIKQEGEDVTVITYGLSVHFAEQAAKELEETGISTHILDLRTVYPMDRDAIVEAAKKTGKVLLVTDDNKEGSVMSEVAAIIAEECLFDLDALWNDLQRQMFLQCLMRHRLRNNFLLQKTKSNQQFKNLLSFRRGSDGEGNYDAATGRKCN